VVARLLFVYKTEYPDPDECIGKLKEGIDKECKKIQTGLHVYQAVTEDVEETVCEDKQRWEDTS
jgi:hypothetical protein